MDAVRWWMVALLCAGGLGWGCSDTADEDGTCADGGICDSTDGDDDGSSATGGLSLGTGGSGGLSSAGDGDGDDDDAGMGDGDGDGDGDGATTSGDGDGDGDTTPPTPVVPTDGSQGAYCESDDDCSDGRGCYAATNICSLPCEVSDDCTGLGGDYACYQPTGNDPAYCRVACTGTDDTTSCPAPQHCLRVQGGVFRCGVEESDLGTRAVPDYGLCERDGDCAGDAAFCYFGYCARSCELSVDEEDNIAACEGAPGGALTPVCGLRTDGNWGGGPGNWGGNGGGELRGVCALPCEPSGPACPGELSCSPYNIGQQRLYFCGVPSI